MEISPAEKVRMMFWAVEMMLVDLVKTGEATLLDNTVTGLLEYAREAAIQAKRKGLYLPRLEATKELGL